MELRIAPFSEYGLRSQSFSRLFAVLGRTFTSKVRSHIGRFCRWIHKGEGPSIPSDKYVSCANLVYRIGVKFRCPLGSVNATPRRGFLRKTVSASIKPAVILCVLFWKFRFVPYRVTTGVAADALPPFIIVLLVEPPQLHFYHMCQYRSLIERQLEGKAHCPKAGLGLGNNTLPPPYRTVQQHISDIGFDQ